MSLVAKSRRLVLATVIAITLTGSTACGGGGAAHLPSSNARPTRGEPAEDAGALHDLRIANAGSDVDPGVQEEPCRSGTTEHDAAIAAVDQLHRAITALPSDADPKPLNDALETLLASECFALAHAADTLAFDSALSLRSWWAAGGNAWVRHYLELDRHAANPRGSNARSESTLLFTAPTPRKTLSRERALASPLAAILCPAAEDECGRETRGWLVRAEAFYAAHAREMEPEYWGRERNDAAQKECHQRALADKDGEAFETFQFCMEQHAARTRALPLGRFRAPKEGWLVLRGRRGHYGFCDEVRAYDLATGTSYVAGTCSGLALRSDGSVDTAKTNAKRVPHALVGRLPLENLREAALMTLLAPETQEDVIGPQSAWPLPNDIVPRRSGRRVGRTGHSGRHTTAQTTLAWTWIVSGRSVASGELLWPNDYNDASRDHAAHLLAIAEEAFEPLKPTECARAAPPSPPPLQSGTGGPNVSPRDGKLDDLSALRELESLRSRTCAAGSRNR